MLRAKQQLQGLVSSHFLKALLFCPVDWVLFCMVRKLDRMNSMAIAGLDGHGLSMSSEVSWTRSLVPSVAMWRSEGLRS